MKDESIVVSVRLPKKLVEKFDRIAEAERRQRSNMMLIALEDWIAIREKQEKQEKKS